MSSNDILTPPTYDITSEPTYWPNDPTKIPDLFDFFVAGGLSRRYLKAKSSLV